jgi:hypothetical protein
MPNLEFVDATPCRSILSYFGCRFVSYLITTFSAVRLPLMIVKMPFR